MSRWRDARQDRRIRENAREASVSSRQADHAMEKTRQQERRIAKLQIIAQAMWQILEEKMGVTEAELVQRITEIERAAANKTEAHECAACGRVTKASAPKCMYCGTPLVRASIWSFL